MNLPFQARSSLKNFTSNGSKGRDTSGSKQNLSTLSPEPPQGMHTRWHEFDHQLPWPLSTLEWKSSPPRVPPYPQTRIQESHGKWTSGCSWRWMHDERHESPATVPESVIWSKVGGEITEPTPLRLVQAVDEETMRVGYHNKPITHQVFVLVVNGRLFSRVAHPL